VILMRKRQPRLVLVGGAIGIVAVAACGTTAGRAHSSPTISERRSSPLAARSAASPSRSGSGSQGHAGACKVSELKITLVHTGAVTGRLGGYIKFTNQGHTVCRLDGWPKVIAQTSSGKSTEASRALHGTMLGGWQYEPPHPVLLTPAASAYAVIEAGDLSSNGTTPCPTYRWLRVRPPAGAEYVKLSAWLPGDATFLPACTSATGSAEIQVSAVVPLSDLAH
jgi:hypothetical protein